MDGSWMDRWMDDGWTVDPGQTVGGEGNVSHSQPPPHRFLFPYRQLIFLPPEHLVSLSSIQHLEIP